MNIEYYNWLGHEEVYAELNPEMHKKKPIKQVYAIDIDENLPFSELLSKLYELTNKSPYLEVEWDGKVEKVATSCYYKTGPDIHDFRIVTDFEKPIREFEKHGDNGELSVHISMTIAYGN